jgi:transposase InsO family protein
MARQKFITPIKASSMQPPPLQHVCKRLGHREVRQKSERRGKMAMRKGSCAPSSEEEVDLADYQHYADAMSQIGRFLDEVYMHKRIHASLGYLTPAEFETHWRQEQAGQPDMN